MLRWNFLFLSEHNFRHLLSGIGLSVIAIICVIIIIYLLNYNYKMICWLHCSISYQIHTFDNNLFKFLYIFLLKNALFPFFSINFFGGQTAPSVELSDISWFWLKRGFEQVAIDRIWPWSYVNSLSDIFLNALVIHSRKICV